MQAPPSLLSGRYRLLSSPGFLPDCEQWNALDEASGRHVLITRLPADQLRRFERVRGEKHLHLTAVLDVIRAGVGADSETLLGSGMVVVEFVAGRTLHGLVRRNPVHSYKAVAWVLRLAHAVQTLHNRGSWHGALCPRCVVVEPVGRAMAPVLAQLVCPALGAYCSPERLEGAGPMPQDDVWALHVTLYTALTGSEPFAGAGEVLAQNVRRGRTQSLTDHGLQEPALSEILRRGLSADARYRTTDLAELVHALDAWERGRQPDPPREKPAAHLDLHGRVERDAIIFDEGALPIQGTLEIPEEATVREFPKRSEYIAIAAQATQAPAQLSDSDRTSALSIPPEGMAQPATGEQPDLVRPPLAIATASQRARNEAPRTPTTDDHRASFQPACPPTEPLSAAVPEAPPESTPSTARFLRLAALLPPLLAVAGLCWAAMRPSVKPANSGGVHSIVVVASASPVRSSQGALEPLPARPEEQLKACVSTYFPEDAPEADANLGFLCENGDLRTLSTTLFTIIGAPQARAAERRKQQAGPAGLVVRGSKQDDLGWYELLATTIVRSTCCRNAAPPLLPRTEGWCQQLQGEVRRVAEASHRSGDLGSYSRRFEDAVLCLFATGTPRPYRYDKAPNDTHRRAYQIFLKHAAESDGARARMPWLE